MATTNLDIMQKRKTPPPSPYLKEHPQSGAEERKVSYKSQ